jgi:trans-aconitate methyltransferase
MSDRQAHWEQVYRSKGEAEVSWYEASPELSLSLLEQAGLHAGLSVIDIGGGASRLVDALVGRGQAHVAVLDLSATALETVRSRLGNPANVDWIVDDVSRWTPARQYDFWHDRAALHFLTEPTDQDAYVHALSKALAPSGRAVIGTFAPDGPEKCSGLTVARHDANSLGALFGDRFRLIDSVGHRHTTPWGSAQQFQFSIFERLG